MNPATIAVAVKIGKQIVQAVRKDRANRYVLTADWVLPKLREDIPDYESGRFRIADGVITVRRYISADECDGATLAPDKIGPWKMVVGTLFHDPWYADMECIAASWGWPVARVRKLGDRIFYAILLAVSPSPLARLYYRFVRLLGGVVHWMALFVVLACVGCCAPDAPFDPEKLLHPDYQKTAMIVR